jgi:hypothetical protein
MEVFNPGIATIDKIETIDSIKLYSPNTSWVVNLARITESKTPKKTVII